MSYSDTLKSYFPPIITDSKVFTEILNAEGIEFDNYYDKLADLELQFDVDTATWALDYYEKDLNIVTDHTKSYDDRRSVIKSKWRGTGKFSSALIKIVCTAYTNGDVDVTFDGTIHVKFVNKLGIPENIEDLKAAIEQIKPAWLSIDYVFTYKLWNDIKDLTWDDLQAYTWEQVLNQTLEANVTLLYTQSSDGTTYNKLEFKPETVVDTDYTLYSISDSSNYNRINFKTN